MKIENQIFRSCLSALALLSTLEGGVSSAQDAPAAIEGLISQTRQSVAAITSSGRDGEASGVGSGFFVGSEGYLVTNFHVTGEGRPFTITLPGGKKLKPGEIIAVDREADLDHVASLELPLFSDHPPGDTVVQAKGVPNGKNLLPGSYHA